MKKVNLNIIGNYTVKYSYKGEKIKENYHLPQEIEVDEDSSIQISIYENKNIFLTILKHALYGFVEIFLINYPDLKKAYFKKYFIKISNEYLDINQVGKKLTGVNKYKTLHIDYLIDFLSFILMLFILSLVVYFAIINHWFEQ